MSRPSYTPSNRHSSLGYEPYQTSEYDRAIQQAADRERAAEAARPRLSTASSTISHHLSSPTLTQPPRLPGLNDLFASKLLINPNTIEGRSSPDHHDDHRRDSVARGSYFDATRATDVSARPRTLITPPLLHAAASHHASQQPKTSPLTIQSLCSAPEPHNLISPTSSLCTSPTSSQSSKSSLIQPVPHSQPTSPSPYELPPAFFGTSDLAPATYVYQAASAYEGVSYIPGRGPCHMYKGGYSIPTHIFQDPVNLTSSKILRKRLSVACSTCRKKKIKCEPGPDGCLQCKKAQKPCRIEPAKRRQKSSASSGVFQAEKSPA